MHNEALEEYNDSVEKIASDLAELLDREFQRIFGDVLNERRKQC